MKRDGHCLYHGDTKVAELWRDQPPGYAWDFFLSTTDDNMLFYWKGGTWNIITVGEVHENKQHS